ncbi:MAG: T9SS-dependent M36 family metallopeptidase [Flavobacteriales bacterium]|nr:T9SS-dependent M36 family metallopeptidase [Flavobacteriales bacterium]
MTGTLRILLLSITCFSIVSSLAQDATTVVRAWLQANHEAYGLEAADVADWTVTSASTDRKGVSYLYIQQRANGLPLQGAVANFAVREGRVLTFGNRLQVGVAARVPAVVGALDAEAALRHAALELGLGMPTGGVLRRTSSTELLLATNGVSHDPIPARLVYQPLRDGSIRLAWDLTIRSLVSPNWWHLSVDANDGSILHSTDHIVHCSHTPDQFTRPYSAWDELVRAPAPPAPMPMDGAGYRVFPFPTESPSHGDHVLVLDPSDATASPFGWHNTTGSPTPQYTITRGNNVYAYEDLANNNFPGYSPSGGPTLLFDFAYTPPQAPVDYLDASITNLFYTCNVLHDVLYRYGFDEQSGNFQVNNFGNGGLGNDEVIAEGQDGGGMNNANFGTPPDGDNGRMQMYLWRASSDSTLFVNSPLPIAGVYTNAVAGFGPPLPAVPIIADVVLAVDGVAPVNNACEGLTNAAEIAGKIALVDRGGCTFIAKVEALQAAGAVAVIVVNNVPGSPIGMGGSGGEGIVIPSVMISMDDGLLIKEALLDGPVNATLVGPSMEDLRDSGFDNGIIAHEYGHGVSIRLTGGGSNVDCLWNDEQMGEGWSDYLGIVFSMRAGDQATTSRGVGTFVRDQPNAGPGIRPAPYTTDMAVNPYTYGDTNDPALTQPHGVGFVWATMLWDMTWALIDQYGYNADLINGNSGNNVALQLVMDGMKLQTCNPGFVDGRDAILLADTLNNGGVNGCLIWNAFAQRGLGYSASQGSSFDRFDQQEAFDLPPACLGTSIAERVAETGFILQPNPATQSTDLVLGSALGHDALVRLRSADGRIVRVLLLRAGGVRVPLDIADLAPSVYLVELQVNGRTSTGRLVVQ